jgi:hypothetical protein
VIGVSPRRIPGGSSGGSHDVRGPDGPDDREVARSRAHIALDLERDGDQISGHADDGGGRPQPFHGWMGLIALIDRLMDGPAAAEGRSGEAEATGSP